MRSLKARELAKNITPATPGILFGNEARLAYINNPKSACTFAQNLLFWINHGYRYIDPIALHYSRYAFWRLGGERGHKSEAAIDRLESLQPEVFTFVRDPMKRFVSSFVSKLLTQSDRGFDDFRDNLTCRGGIDLSPQCDRKTSVLRFAEWLLGYKHRPNEIDSHFRPQIYNIYFNGRPSSFYTIDRVIKLESVREVMTPSLYVGRGA